MRPPTRRHFRIEMEVYLWIGFLAAVGKALLLVAAVAAVAVALSQ